MYDVKLVLVENTGFLGLLGTYMSLTGMLFVKRGIIQAHHDTNKWPLGCPSLPPKPVYDTHWSVILWHNKHPKVLKQLSSKCSQDFAKQQPT